MRRPFVEQARAIRFARGKASPTTLIAAATATVGYLCSPPSAYAQSSADGAIGFSQLHPLQEYRPLPPVSLPGYASSTQLGLQLIRPTAPATLQPHSVTDAIWIGLGNSPSWTNSANWSTNLVPDGTLAVARFRNISGGPIARLGNGSVTLNTLEMSDQLLSAVVAGTINLTGDANVLANGVNFDLPDSAILFSPADPSTGFASNNIGGAGSFGAVFAGTSGLNKTGDSHIQIESNQSYTGTTTISGGGKIISIVGDQAFGGSANPIVLNGGSILFASTDWSSSRTINVLDGGGNIHWVGSGREINFSGNITGTGSLQISGAFGLTGACTITTGQSFAGSLAIGLGTVSLSNDGAFASALAIRNAGTLLLNNQSSPTSINRLADAAPITMRGSALAARAGSSDYTETAGPVSLDGGTNFISAFSTEGAPTRLNLGALSRSSGAGVMFRGNDLGNPVGSGGNANIFISNGTSLLVKNLIPFAWANPSYDPFFSAVETPEHVLVSYDASAGVVPITNYNSDFSGSTVNTNVRLGSNTSLGSGSVAANALVLSAPANLQVVSGNPAIVLSGSGTLHVDSGAVLSAFAGFNNISMGIYNSLPGNQISANLDFGTREAVIMTPSALSISGAISGSGGLSKVGGRTAQFSGPSTYTGTTSLTGLVRFLGNVLADGTPGPFGISTTPIVLYGGNVTPVSGAGDISGSGFGQLAGANAASSTFNRPLEIRGDNALLRNFGTGTLVWGGSINLIEPQTILTFLSSTSITSGRMIVNGVISGPGRVENGTNTTTDFMSPNTFTGGFDLNGTVNVGSDQALSTGSVVFHSDGAAMLNALAGPRNLANKLVILAGTSGSLTLGGSNPLTLSGEINGRGGDYLLNVSNTATTTFSGPLTGGAFRKTGSGTLVVSGDNTFDSVMTVGNGSIAGGMVILRSNTATGTVIGSTFVFEGENTLALDGAAAAGGNLNIGEETLFLAGDGMANLGSLRNLSGNNVWGGIVRPSAAYDSNGSLTSQRASISVEPGTTLTIDSTIISSDPGVINGSGTVVFLGNSIGLRKLGAGTLVVGSDVIASSVGSNSFEWNGAVVTTGSLDIQGGTLMIKPGAGVGTIGHGRAITDVGSINIIGGSANPTAKLDLTDNAMVVDYTGASPLADVRAYIKKGQNGGDWLGNGITSSRAATSPNSGELHKTGIGYGEASSLHITSFLGDPVDSTTIVMRYTYIADADLDGDVDGVDIGIWATNFTGELGGIGNKAWTEGDWDYDGDVDGVDAGLWAQNFTGELGGNGLGSIVIDSPIAPQARAILQGMGITVVPEPQWLGLAGLLAAGRLLRRKSLNHKLL
ncbi:MAG TPA: hypothetical protein VH518_01420 [Tepidisphaeraceae bacterium]|jgi:autotransporter-associated beta strand protein